MAEPLATQQDVGARLGRTLSEAEAARVDALLDDASAEVRAYTGQHITPATSTVTLPVGGGRVVLPQRPVVEVHDVETALGHAESFELIGGTLRGIVGCEATVTYSHGYETVPGDLVSVVCAMVLRGLATPPAAPLHSRETIGEYSYGIPESALARRVTVDRTDRSTLDRYKTPELGAIWLAMP